MYGSHDGPIKSMEIMMLKIFLQLKPPIASVNRIEIEHFLK